MGTRQGPWEWMCNCCSDVCDCCKHFCRCNCFCKCCRKICPNERLCACCPEICPCDCAAGLCAQNPDWLQPDEVSAEDYIDQKPREAKARVTWNGPVNSMLRSCGGFATGAMLTILYAAIVLFVKNYNLWYCIGTSLAFGCFLCLGMAFSVTVRINVLLMLPQLFSGEGKAAVLLVAFSLAVQGPGANIFENFHRSTESVSCGVELATNQTKELLETVKRPLVNALNSLKNIGRKLKGAADKAKRFFKTIMGSAKHISRSLLRVWRFIANMGEICNEELEGPYRKCNKLFDEAKDSCLKVMSFLSFLCYILEAFRPLCGLAKIILVFCLLPHYVQRFVKNNLKNPIVNTIRNIKDSFDFNITVNHRFDVTLNASKTVTDVASGIMKEVQRAINPYLDILSIFSYSMTFVCIYLYFTADSYRRNYLYEDNHDNIYITREFIELDVMRARQGRDTLLPLSMWEAYKFIRPGSLYLTRRELQGYSFAIINVFRNLLIVIFMVLVDYLVFWILDMAHHLLQGDIVARAPMTVYVAVNGSGLISEIFTSVVSAFDILQRANLTVLSQKCLILPSEPDFRGYLVLGAMYGLAFFITIFGVYVQRLNRTICACYHPSREQERICFLYNNLAAKRLNTETALIKSVKMKAEDAGHTNILFLLAAKFPAFQWLLQLLGSTDQYCMGCATVVSGTSGLDYLPCVTTGCKGLYCKGCVELLNNVCAICMAPLAYSEAMDKEIDSSDEEAVHVYIEAINSLRAKEKEKRRKMRALLKDHLRQIIRSRGEGEQSQMLLQKYRAEVRRGESSSENSETENSEDSGEMDNEYQDKSEDRDESDTEAVAPSRKPKKNTDLVYTIE